MSDLVPRNELAGQAVKGIGAVAGGLALLILAGGGLFGILAGGVLTIVGLALSGSQKDRTAGIVTAVVGIATLATGIFGGRFLGFSWLMRVAGIVLLGAGGFGLVKFFRGMKKRM